MRIAIGIEYDGTAYNGWQRQRTGEGVQAYVEAALTAVADEAIEVSCAGRTDTGVHASGQAAHFDTQSERSERGWLLGANSNLPDDIVVTWVRPVSDEFHARYSATARSYRYVILNQMVRSALSRQRAWWVYQPLDAARMHEAAQDLLGSHDFSAFRAAGCQASTPVRELRSIAIDRHGDWITLQITANAFLQHMVRNITGTLMLIGSGDSRIGSMGSILAGRDRNRAGPAAPPHGLTLVHVEYPDTLQIPSGSEP
ncbi:MAG: tRNA pseudouridine(38-40) synthase TruA [Proteobacteria bacterium]|nr:tRNA pseudouridine(38-40) synthase TruA [Pseudomonadota bacterium]MDA1064231.1 tRNA pseudouridine(38-40) synthase TruA [Pseudomonadota bacterium]